jgi:hypothetical protein
MEIPPNWTWRDGTVHPGQAAVIDIDGVLADAWHRQHHLDGADKNWDNFFGEAHADPPLQSLIGLLAIIDRDYSVILLTARPNWVRQMTLDWLGRNEVRWDLLAMRGETDGYVAAGEFKRRTVSELRERGFELLIALEDDPNNVAMFNEEGVPCVYIHSGYYE